MPPRALSRRLDTLLVLLGVAFAASAAGLARAEVAAPTAAAASAADLPPLPEVPSVARPTPSAAELERLDTILNQLIGEDDGVRRDAIAEVATVHAGLVAAIAKRLDQIASSADRTGMKAHLLESRDKAREQVRREMRAAGTKGEVVTPDYFEFVAAQASPSRSEWRDLVSVLAMSRMLTGIETVDAVRVLVEVYARFSFLRVDTQLQLEKLGDRAVAGLIETRRHRAAEVARWAERQLDAIGRAIPSEAIQVRDPEALADILRAYGRVRDPDAARLLVSFANSERAQIREAARQGIALMGDVGLWQLRDAYESTVGKRPPRDWTWQRLARELFADYDRLRLAHVYQLFTAGREAERSGDLAAMRAAYDKVLTRSPQFEHRAEMSSGYLAFALHTHTTDAAAAEAALDRVLRLSPDAVERARAESLRLTLLAERWRQRGVLDQELLVRATELDPANERARLLLDDPGADDTEPRKRLSSRWLAALLIALVAAIGALVITLWPRRRREDPAAAPSPPPEASPATAAPAAEPAPAASPAQDDADDATAPATEPAPAASPSAQDDATAPATESAPPDPR